MSALTRSDCLSASGATRHACSDAEQVAGMAILACIAVALRVRGSIHRSLVVVIIVIIVVVVLLLLLLLLLLRDLPRFLPRGRWPAGWLSDFLTTDFICYDPATLPANSAGPNSPPQAGSVGAPTGRPRAS